MTTPEREPTNRAGDVPYDWVGRRLLLVVPWYRPTLGGVVETARRLQEHLPSRGIGVDVLTSGEERRIVPVPGAADAWRVTVPDYVFNMSGPRAWLATLVRGLVTFTRLLRFVRRRRIDGVLLWYPSEFGWMFLFLCRLLRLPLILSFHGSDVRLYGEHGVLRRWLLRAFVRQADHVFVASEELADRLRALAPRVAVEPEVVWNAVELDRFRPSDRAEGEDPDSPFTFIHVSNFASLKRTPLIVDAFADAERPPRTRLLMVGDGPEREAARERARVRGLDDQIQFLGRLDDVRPALAAADAMILASDQESSPLVLIEAMASGLPWIASACGMAAELEDAECGLLFEPGDREGLKEAIEQLAHDPERARKLGRSGRALAEARFGVDVYIDAYANSLRAIIDPTGGLSTPRESTAQGVQDP